MTIPIAVLCSEFSRFLFWLIWTKGHESLNQDAGKTLDSVSNLFWESVAAVKTSLFFTLFSLSFSRVLEQE